MRSRDHARGGLTEAGTTATIETVAADKLCSDRSCSGIGYPPMNRLLFGYWTWEIDDADPEP